MKNLSKKTIGLLLAIVIVFSLMPMSAFAVNGENTQTTGQDNSGAQIVSQNDEALEENNEEPSTNQETTWYQRGQEKAADDSDEAEVVEVGNAITPKDSSQGLAKVVEGALVNVVYHYFDAAQKVNSIPEYTILSSHSFGALAKDDGTNISIIANKYPGVVNTNTDAKHLRVMVDGNQDVTAQVIYDTKTGTVSLPNAYMGHKILIEWYCPNTEVVELPVKAAVSHGRAGSFKETVHEMNLASNTNTLSIPIESSSGIVVTQNGVEIGENLISVDGKTLKEMFF